jgi:NTE family protein
MFYSVATQTYTGDINLMPRYRLFNPTKLLTPPSEKELMFFIKEGERATFPKVERLRIASKISRALDQILKRYERRALRDAHRISSNTASTPFGERRISAA